MPRNGKKSPGLLVAVDIGGSNLRVALADVRGNVLARRRSSTKETSSPQEVIAQIEESVDDLLKQQAASRSSLLSIAAGAPGVTDANSGVVLATSYLRGWTDVPFQHLLESAFRVPATVENDVRLAAVGEHWMGAARGVDDFVFLAIGTGIGAGIFSNGQLIRGHNCTAGEVGYMYVPGAPQEQPQPGSPGSLERAIGGEGIRERWSQACAAGEYNRSLTATEIFNLAASGDSQATRVLDRSAKLLAYALYNISVVLNSSLFVLGGSIGVSMPLRDATESILKQYNQPMRPKLVISSLGTDAQLLGAVGLALTKAEARNQP